MQLLATVLAGLLAVAKADADWASSQVHLLGDDAWEDFRNNNPKFLSVFFAPWCGHCKALQEPFAAAADHLQFRVPLVAVDCTAEGKATCASFDVTGFPTLKWFDSSDGEAQDYSAGRTTQDIIDFVTDKVGDQPDSFPEDVDFRTFRVKQLKQLLYDRGQTCTGCSEKHDFVKKVQETIHLPKTGPPAKKKKKKSTGSSMVNGRTVAQERRWKEAVRVAEEGWEANGAVVHLITDDFQKHREAKAPALLTMFYAPWCGHCKTMKPHLVETSEVLLDQVGVAAVDCVTNDELCRKYKVKSYPVVLFFNDASIDNKGEVYAGRTAKGMIKWLRARIDPEYEEVVEPFVNEAVWDENGSVIHMDEDHWEEYRQNTRRMLTMFYAPWCGHCKAMKPAFASASAETNLPFVAVDCTVHNAVCSKFDVTGYPTIKYFNGDEVEDYDGGRTHAALVAFGDEKEGSGSAGSAKEEL